MKKPIKQKPVEEQAKPDEQFLPKKRVHSENPTAERLREMEKKGT